MQTRPDLDSNIDSKLFRDFYYLKEELKQFCRENNLPTSGGKLELTERIAYFLDTGKLLTISSNPKKYALVGMIDVDTKIEANFVCTEKHRAFFENAIGKSFSFNVTFQRWLKNNAGKTYREAIEAYEIILLDKKKGKTSIDKQFEYNTYIRDFFADNKGKSIKEAIQCWKYKKQLQGHNRYEKADLVVLQKEGNDHE